MQLYTTFLDMGEVPPERAWSALRALRASPPGLATRSDRRRVFTSALEQGEQLFRAAAGVGIETKPLLAFYGLSQAGRALAAAATGDPWRLMGHGITAGKDGAKVARLADATVSPDGGGSFGRMVDVLGSSTIPAATRLGDLWPLLIETVRHPLPGQGDTRSLGVHVNRAHPASGSLTIEVQELPERLLDVGQERRDVANGVGGDYDAQAAALDAFLSSYPTLSPRMRTSPAGQPVGLQPQGDGCSVTFGWPRSEGSLVPAQGQLLDSIAVTARGEARVFPTLDGGPLPVHPLLVWWAILFRLSMLARYEPEAWGAMTDVNASADAVPIEHALGVAMSSVPELLFNALTGSGSNRAN